MKKSVLNSRALFAKMCKIAAKFNAKMCKMKIYARIFAFVSAFWKNKKTTCIFSKYGLYLKSYFYERIKTAD